MNTEVEKVDEFLGMTQGYQGMVQHPCIGLQARS